MNLGKCPVCNSNLITIFEYKEHQKITIYTCENTNNTYNKSCNFKVFSNVFIKSNQKDILIYEKKSLIDNKEIAIGFYKQLKNTPEQKYAVLDRDYGVSILWN